MSTTRRRFVQGGLAAGAAMAAPAYVRAQPTPSAARTIKAVLHADLRVFDPIWTSAQITSYHGGMIYDTLLGKDDNFDPQPQMVSRWNASDDNKTYTFELRDGLRFSDGSAVTSRDCVASIRRWAARDAGGLHMLARLADTPVKDEKTFQVVMNEPYPLIPEWLSKSQANVCFIMKEKAALTDPMQQVTSMVGSGPFLFNQDATVQGQRYIYDKNPNYNPRSEPASGTAGGKVVLVDRVVYENISDDATAVAAIRAGEVDFVEFPNVDLLDQISDDPAIKLETMSKLGNLGQIRLNHLHPPFDNIKARQAMLHLVHPTDIMKATLGDPKYYRGCSSLFGMGNVMENDVNTDWFKQGQNMPRARQLVKESGYDGRPIVILQATNLAYNDNAARLVAQWMRDAGFNVTLAASDWGSILTRRTSMAPPSQGGWNIFFTFGSVRAFDNPISVSSFPTSGVKGGWYGWPNDPVQEALRDKWGKAATLEDRKQVAREMQQNAWDFVPFLYFGQWTQPAAARKLTGLIYNTDQMIFWNLKKG